MAFIRYSQKYWYSHALHIILGSIDWHAISVNDYKVVKKYNNTNDINAIGG